MQQIFDGSGNVTGKTGTPVYYVSNLHAGKRILSGQSEKIIISFLFLMIFSSVMDEIEKKEYKEKTN